MKKSKDFNGENTCTLYSFEYNNDDKVYLKNLFIDIVNVCPNIQISSIRSNYDMKPMLEKLDMFQEQFSYLRYDKNWVDLAGYNIVSSSDLPSTLVELWCNFEDNCFVFYQNSPQLSKGDDLSNLVLDNCENTVRRANSYCLTGGGVSDSIMIYKSSSLGFDFLS